MAEIDASPAPPASGWRRAAPWVAAVVLAVVCALVAAALPHVHGVSARARAAQGTGAQVALPVNYQKAVLAAGTEAVNLLTYSRKNFAADWNRALAGATGGLRSDHAKQRAQTLSTMTKNKVDWRADLQQKAFESADEKGNVLVLITINGYLVSDSGQRSSVAPQRLELTMVEQGGKWLASDLSAVGIQ
jgi:hypothetical protein